MVKSPSILETFFRYNVIALIATAMDFAILILLTEVFQIWYLFSTFWGAVAGGITAFILNRNWTFMKRGGKLSFQAIKFIAVWGCSILLNIVGIYLFVAYLGWQYMLSKVIIAIVVGMGFNFYMQKTIVFK